MITSNAARGMAAACLVASVALGQAGGGYTLEREIRFTAGDANMRAGLSRNPAVRDIVAEEFSIGVDDLDDDGKQEVIVAASSSAYCGSGGCLTVVLRNSGPGQLETIFEQNLFPGLGVTRERIHGYRLLAALDGKGGIARGDRPGTPLYGKPMVYAMNVAATAAQTEAPNAVTGATPGGSGNGVDVIGIRVGNATIAEARAVLQGVRPALSIVEGQTRLVGMSSAGRGIPQPVEIGAQYVSQIDALTQPYDRNQRCNGRISGSGGGSCEDIRVVLSGPPEAGIVLGVKRFIHFDQGSATDNIVSGLIQKYGRPGLQQQFGDRGGQHVLTWAWDGAGRSVPLSERHLCANRSRAFIAIGAHLHEQQEHARARLEAGCTATIVAVVQSANGVVQVLDVMAVDQRAVHDRNASTGRFVAEKVAIRETQERDKAEKTAVPNL